MEIWKQIPEYPNYEASSEGRIRRAVGGQGTRAGYVLKPKPHEYGYHLYALSHNNHVKYESEHRLVALAFHGPPPFLKSQVAHKDGNPTNTCPDNLRWDTAKGNADDMLKHGTRRFGERHQNSKLKEVDVREIRRLRKLGVKLKVLSATFGVSPSNISAADRGRQWACVTDIDGELA